MRLRNEVRQVALGLLMALAITGVSLMAALQVINNHRSHLIRIRNDFHNLNLLARGFEDEKHRQPESLSELAAFFPDAVMPRDPWGRDYLLELADNQVRFQTRGRDGAVGSTGFDADLSSDFWNPDASRITLRDFMLHERPVSTVSFCLLAGALAGSLTFRELRAGRLRSRAWGNWLLTMGLWLGLSAFGAGVAASLHHVQNGH